MQRATLTSGMWRGMEETGCFLYFWCVSSSSGRVLTKTNRVRVRDEDDKKKSLWNSIYVAQHYIIILNRDLTQQKVITVVIGYRLSPPHIHVKEVN